MPDSGVNLFSPLALSILNRMSGTGPNTSMPLVLLSYAQSLDGRIATRTGQSKWISGKRSLALTHRLRATSDAILVGVGTIVRDDPELTCRLESDGTVGSRIHKPSPDRFIIDPRLRTPPEAKVVTTTDTIPTTLFALPSDEPAVNERRRQLEAAGVRIETSAATLGAANRISVRSVCELVGARGFRSLMVEGGAATITGFLREGCCDRMVITIAPLVIGTGVEAVADLSVASLDEAIHARLIRWLPIGDDLVADVILTIAGERARLTIGDEDLQSAAGSA